MSEPLINQLLGFYIEKDIEFFKIGQGLHQLPEEEINSIRFTTFINSNENIFITISLKNKGYSGLSKKVFNELNVENFRYDKQGKFNFDVTAISLVQVLEEISKKTSEILKYISSKIFQDFLKKPRLISKSFLESNFFHTVEKETYLKIHNVEDCIWLGDISLFIQQSSDDLTVKCFLENKDSKKLKLLKQVKFNQLFPKIENLILELKFVFHSTLKITKDLYIFFCKTANNWVDFKIKYQKRDFNDKLFLLKSQSSDEKQIKISNKASESPDRFLDILNKSVSAFSYSHQDHEED
jgi:hypothetical protein